MLDHGAGGATSVAAGRVSYTFGLKGPCVSIDTACSSSLVGMHYSARDVSVNTCDQAVAAGVNLVLNPGKTAAFTVTGKEQRLFSSPDCHMSPEKLRAACSARSLLKSYRNHCGHCQVTQEAAVAMSWQRLLTATHGCAGMLAADGRCKVLDAAADGYVRSEDCIVTVLQVADADSAPCRAILRGSAVGQVCILHVYTVFSAVQRIVVQNFTASRVARAVSGTHMHPCCGQVPHCEVPDISASGR